jgi:hypothetical protein
VGAPGLALAVAFELSVANDARAKGVVVAWPAAPALDHKS